MESDTRAELEHRLAAGKVNVVIVKLSGRQDSLFLTWNIYEHELPYKTIKHSPLVICHI